MLDKIENEIKINTELADIRGSVLMSVLASFKKEEIAEKIEGAQQLLSSLEKPISINQLYKDLVNTTALFEQSITACSVLSWVKSEIENDMKDTEDVSDVVEKIKHAEEILKEDNSSEDL